MKNNSSKYRFKISLSIWKDIPFLNKGKVIHLIYDSFSLGFSETIPNLYSEAKNKLLKGNLRQRFDGKMIDSDKSISKFNQLTGYDSQFPIISL